MPKAPRWENEDWKLTLPDLEKIHCKDCFHRMPDVGSISGATKGVCRAYPVTKPKGVLWDGDRCLYYLNENEE